MDRTVSIGESAGDQNFSFYDLREYAKQYEDSREKKVNEVKPPGELMMKMKNHTSVKKSDRNDYGVERKFREE